MFDRSQNKIQITDRLVNGKHNQNKSKNAD